jgi:hypothetical protein
MSTVQVNTMEIVLKTLPLTTKLLRQMQSVGYHDYIRICKEEPQRRLGWVNGAALEKDEGHLTLVLVEVAPGDIRTYEAHFEVRKQLPQIFIP